MREEPGSEDRTEGSGPPPEAALLVHLTGSHRGRNEPLGQDPVRIGTSAEADLHFAKHRQPEVAEHHAVLFAEADGHLLRRVGDAPVRVNGEEIEGRRLEPGDLIELGDGGPILRYRRPSGPGDGRKTMGQALEDCLDSARLGSDRLPGKLWILARAVPRALLTQASPAYRVLVLVLLLVVLAGTTILAINDWRLERRLDRETRRVYAELLEGDQRVLTAPELESIRAELEDRLAEAVERVTALEEQSQATRRTISEASRAVVFLQGSYGFLDPAAGEPVRVVLGPDGRPITDPRGAPLVGPDAEGPVLERLFTGTAFVATEDGLLLTNRHVALPWEIDEGGQRMIGRGFVPVMHRLIGYLPEEPESFDVTLVVTSQEADLAVLRCSGITNTIQPLPLAQVPPQAGDEVLVLGYPTGIRALLARSEPAFVDRIIAEEGIDFWAVARRLSAEGHIAPLATRGIVGQVTPATVVYDAETTSGGSGGPVLTIDREVVAVNAAILAEFGGSNLGVPADKARRLLAGVPGSGEDVEGAADPSVREVPVGEPPDSSAGPDTGS